ncbi:glycosyl transferases group 1-domain-containing protein [Dunaliella salina]|uniref:Glycosyl transferases group 1-domain-containing protein n=1 Tax=Dunaliella salina TaxID=3046 RepID=A0ABQ7GCY2_DUNSA|nr:glycosyl transferases group 1-domain-containing protein [Dunaliella salina]|eukprot:KAF5832474.1 glycosyl transferases group 1-domain-containing protein [Dunaliella salina]
MVRRSLFSDISGLDLSYGRGYFEDTDLAMAVRAHGYQVYMQPLAVVYHQEGSTLGTDESAEKQALMAANRRIFLSKWQAQLSSQHVPPSTPYHLAATQRYRRHILWVDDMIPEPDGDSGSVRMYHLWHVLLSEGFHITFFPNMFRYLHYALMARMHGVHIVLNRNSLVQRGCPYDVIGVSRKPVFAAWLRVLRVLCPKVPIIFDTVDLAFIREGRLALSKNYTMQPSIDSLIATIQADPQLTQLLDSELQLVRQSSVSLVVSDSEKQILDRFNTSVPVHIVSNIYEPQGSSFKCEGRRGLLFVGNMAHEPNRQAITYFVDSILPLLLGMLTPEEAKDFTFHVVGANLFDKDFPALHKEHVTFDGHASDEQLRALYMRTRLVVAPLLAGAGVKGKISQAMSFGVPVVATSVAVEGMHLNNGTDCFIADTPTQFAAAVVEPYRSCTRWQELSDHGLRNVVTFFSKESAQASLLQVLSSLGVT